MINRVLQPQERSDHYPPDNSSYHEGCDVDIQIVFEKAVSPEISQTQSSSHPEYYYQLEGQNRGKKRIGRPPLGSNRPAKAPRTTEPVQTSEPVLLAVQIASLTEENERLRDRLSRGELERYELRKENSRIFNAWLEAREDVVKARKELAALKHAKWVEDRLTLAAQKYTDKFSKPLTEQASQLHYDLSMGSATHCRWPK